MASGDLYISEDFSNELKEVFPFFADNKKVINVKDFETAIRCIDSTISENDLKVMIDDINQNHKGNIDFSVFLNFANSRVVQENSEEDIIKSFQIFDKENTGFISSSELRVILANLGEKMTEEEIDEMIREGEIDAEGKFYYRNLVKKMNSE